METERGRDKDIERQIDKWIDRQIYIINLEQRIYVHKRNLDR